MSTPISQVSFYKVPALSPTYRDSYYFNDADDQEAFFNTMSPLALSPSQVTRITNNQIKVPYPVEAIREYNYMSIKNQKNTESEGDAPSDRTFYCFIVNAEYISQMCTLITFKVDVIQTYIVDANIREGFVERCHTKTDKRYEHREPEPFTVQEYTLDKQQSVETPIYVVLGIVNGTEITIGDSTYTTSAFQYLNGRVLSGSEYMIFDPTDSSELTVLRSILNSLVGTPEKITDFYTVPASSYNGATGVWLSVTSVGELKDINVDILPSANSDVSGYTPNNKKLYNYPFTKIVVKSCEGDTMELMGEEFHNMTEQDTTVTFQERGAWYGGGEATLTPYDYSSETFVGFGGNAQHFVTLHEFPQCSFSGDSFEMWKAQKMEASMVKGAISNFSGLAMSGAVMGVFPMIGALSLVSGAKSTMSDGASIIGEAIESSRKPNPLYNHTNSSSVPLAYQYFGWVFQRVSLSKAEAEQMDNFFTMFGYAQNKIMNIRDYLNENTRPKFKYIKTKAFNVQGSFPSEYKLEFNDVFNTGITFWKTNADVGDYSNNNPTS